MRRQPCTASLLRNCWLLADLDGTLVSTPHKAHGQYLPISRGPCFNPLVRWLGLGGNLCVITTADRRVFDQVYIPLRDHLAETPQRQNGGNVLLSVYTGAVMYECLRSQIREVEGYSFDAAIPASAATAEECSTCFSDTTCSKVVSLISDIFLRFAEDVLRGNPEATHGLTLLSKRYQMMWTSLLKYLDKRFHAAVLHRDSPHRPHSTISSKWQHLDSFLDNTAEWKVQYLRSKRGLLCSIGIIRKEYLKSGEELTTAILKEKHQHAAHATAEAERISAVKSDDGGEAQPIPHLHARVAQVIVVGTPLKLATKYFAPHDAEFAALGVHPIVQPNSVVFSKLGVGKGTTVRYLTKPLSGGVGGPVHNNPHSSLLHSADIGLCIGLGDNPHSADRELATIPPLSFVSFETHEQRIHRHQQIDGRIPSVSNRPMLDDRKLKNIAHVGGEEEGCADFLTRLMDQLTAEHAPADGSGFKDTGLFQAAFARCSQEASRQKVKTILQHL